MPAQGNALGTRLTARPSEHQRCWLIVPNLRQPVVDFQVLVRSEVPLLAVR